MQALDEWLDQQPIDGIETLPADDENPERFKLTSTDAADWAFRKLAKIKAERAEHVETAAFQQQRIDAWLEQVCAPLDNSVDYFEGLLREWAAGQVLEELADVQDWSKVRHKTLSTPNGKVSARKSVNGSFTTSEEGRQNAIEALVEHGLDDLLNITYKVAASPLEDARDNGLARLNDRDEYEVLDRSTGEWVPLPGVRREGRGTITFKVETT